VRSSYSVRDQVLPSHKTGTIIPHTNLYGITVTPTVHVVTWLPRYIVQQMQHIMALYHCQTTD